MEERFNIHVIIDDEGNKTHLLATVDTKANEVLISQGKPLDDSDAAIEKLFNEKVNYHLNISSSFVVRLVDELQGIEVKGEKIDGKKALQLVRDDKLDEVVDALSKTLEKRNLLKTIPSLLTSLNDTYQMDIAFMDIFKTLLSEINEINDWKVKLVR
ncbi:MAG: hypothetical protein IJI46_07935 [Erysipelotrichaceae bacterium]|nr:hypothetical protein [Erysipelotrichaceae bacterium]